MDENKKIKYELEEELLNHKGKTKDDDSIEEFDEKLI